MEDLVKEAAEELWFFTHRCEREGNDTCSLCWLQERGSLGLLFLKFSFCVQSHGRYMEDVVTKVTSRHRDI